MKMRRSIVTQDEGAGWSGVHVAAIDGDRASLTGQEIAEPDCEMPAFGYYEAF